MEIEQLILEQLDGGLGAGMAACQLAAHTEPVVGAAVCRGPRIVLCCQGRHRMTVSGHTAPITLAVGDGLLMPDGCWNRAEPGMRRRYCSFGLQPDGLRYFYRRHDGQGLGTSPAHVELLPRPSQDDQALWRLALEATDAVERCALVRAILQRCRSLLVVGSVPRRTAADRWAAIQAWLEEQLPALPTRVACAEHFSLHPAYLSQLCKDQLGVSFQDCCGQMRLSYARSLLQAHPDMAVAEVARCCGYGDARYFRRMYKRFFAQPPSAERSSRKVAQASIQA